MAVRRCETVDEVLQEADVSSSSSSGPAGVPPLLAWNSVLSPGGFSLPARHA